MTIPIFKPIRVEDFEAPADKQQEIIEIGGAAEQSDLGPQTIATECSNQPLTVQDELERQDDKSHRQE